MNAVAEKTMPSAQPDITLLLDLDGVIQEATVSASFSEPNLEDWVGLAWHDTVVDPGRSKVRRIIDDARQSGVSAFRQINQRFPSGLELPVEYTAVRQGRRGLVAVGKSLQAVAELQTKLNAAQHAIERDYWKLREVETRCRLLFDRSNEAVLLVRATGLQVVEANPAALRALGLAPREPLTNGGPGLLSQVAPEERSAFELMLQRVRDHGKAPGVLVHLTAERTPWLVRCSLLPSQDGLSYLIQMTPAAAEPGPDEDELVPTEALVARAPDGFVVLDRAGRILSANQAFLDLVEVGDDATVSDEPLSRWLGRPGADMAVLLAGLARSGEVRLFSTTVHGELGTASEVELSAASDDPEAPTCIGVWIRHVAARLPESEDPAHSATMLERFAARVGRASLPELVKEATGEVEWHCIQAALELTAGNRTAAAQLLGVSRQSLHSKLNRYGADGAAPNPPSGDR